MRSTAAKLGFKVEKSSKCWQLLHIGTLAFETVDKWSTKDQINIDDVS